MVNSKKGDVWVSAVLYFGLGIVIIAILLAAGLPVINKLRDKNVVIQTKEVMHTLDNNIRQVIKDGSGSQRVVTLNVKKGNFNIDDTNNRITWLYEGSKAVISEPGVDVTEGKLRIRTTQTGSTYTIEVSSSYDGLADITTVSGRTSLTGLNDLVVRNTGLVSVGGRQLVGVSISEPSTA
ncbi:MAG TPA: hypothetical protein VJI68_01785 [Candidatus Nanoarchaeia archaeon]|nr:hypothetical protein [Candidatus Nanoarchaeia archaeon]